MKPIMLVTGGNAGMGLETVIRLAQAGAKVVLLSRDPGRGAAAREEALRRCGDWDADIDLMSADLASLASIDTFADCFQSRYPRLDVLVNNAGVVTLRRETTEDGFERMLGVNHLGHFALTNRLMDSLRAAPSARIVVVSSGAHKAGKIHYPDPHLHRGFNVARGYAQSKLANLLFAFELRERLRGSSVQTHALHPGAVATTLGISRETGFGRGVYKVLRPFFKTAEEGAETALHLALSEEGGREGSLYYVNNKPVHPSAKAEDREASLRLWEWSEAQTGVRWNAGS
ncbi:SDR family oxidoreductase [Paenibacillus pasadenensis]|uniref:SDR family oxidoreductase n=1 Tax=Paenibacillus pasadenensis TaxID=217090 RepID=UPI00204250F7|nr:SDR family oxidoreductase [Paenibacillus pasadenensis]MCM3748541.1 SDR family oxidoreductase [Paenibacillus pasadenensis]